MRTAIATARALSLALDRPALGVTTLEAIALAARRQRDDTAPPIACLVVLDTRRDDLYAQRFAPDGVPLDEPIATMPEPLIAELSVAPLLLAGDAVDRIAPALAARGIAVETASGPGCEWPDATFVAEIGEARLGEASLANSAPRPLYLRAPEARKPASGGRLRP